MRWQGQRESDHIEDRRNESYKQGFGSRNFGGIGFGLLSLGRGRGLILLVVIYLGLTFFGYNPTRFLFGDGTLEKKQIIALSDHPSNISSEKTERDHFIATVLGQTEDVWTAIFSAQNQIYKKPFLVRYNGQIQSACGFATAAMGPFYCANDQKLYLDDHFFDQLANQYGAPGEFANAYVIAHEVGHHVQKLLGTLDKVNDQRRFLNSKDANLLSVKLELQADCYAGIWAHYTQEKGLLEPGDIESALNAAHQIGDDTLERKAQGYVVPDSFTHGTAQQRMDWFTIGYQKGSIPACNTFNKSF